jgi:hypothetical protein
MSALIATGASIRETWEALKASGTPMAEVWALVVKRIADRATSDQEIRMDPSVGEAFAKDMIHVYAEIQSDVRELRADFQSRGPEFNAFLDSHLKLADTCQRKLSKAFDVLV